MTTGIRYWAVIPAAGIGSRMQAEVPKQYLSINHKTILEHTLERFCSHPKIEGVVVAIAGNDNIWKTLGISSHPKITVVEGGVERCHSVLNGLRALSDKAHVSDWVLVHDAARPCLRKLDIDRLIESLDGHNVGGLLGLPVKDTMKRADRSFTIQETVEREGLWHALTPQMFRFKLLKDALESALKKNNIVTDEASAMELAGYQPLLVEGHADNLKITQPEDLALASFFLVQQKGNT
ncbi:MAG: 2-C-methyl-D-erythritol 4-phosphate cytidylyltransferase [Gammaproteobacteria bacterium]|nr:2-C-methyl-D-erythritol 4-phosphate cytidylyltransferase [Gammaproteobacteria bacterium]